MLLLGLGKPTELAHWSPLGLIPLVCDIRFLGWTLVSFLLCLHTTVSISQVEDKPLRGICPDLDLDSKWPMTIRKSWRSSTTWSSATTSLWGSSTCSKSTVQVNHLCRAVEPCQCLRRHGARLTPEVLLDVPRRCGKVHAQRTNDTHGPCHT